jgi:parvulin-like peptidyl-prolyl isomerase
MTKKAPYVLAAVAALTLAPAGWRVQAEIIEQVLVKVNGEIFTKSDLESRQITALRQLQQGATTSDEQLRKMLADVTPQLIVSAVDEMLLVQRGNDLGYRMADEQFQSVLENLKKDNKIETDEQFQAALKQENMTIADLRRNIERQAIVSRVQQNEVLSKITVTEEEAREYYKTHAGEFTAPQSVTLREILVSVAADASPDVDAAAKEKAGTIRQRALAGDSFEKLAADLSDAPSRANAGLIGPLNAGDLSPELQKLIQGMKAGEVSDVLRSTSGYQVLRLESSTSPETTPFEEAREEVSNRLFAEKRRVEGLKFLERLRAEAIIEFKNDDLKKAYDAGLEQQKNEGSSSN